MGRDQCCGVWYQLFAVAAVGRCFIMKKRISALFLMIVLCLSFGMAAFAKEENAARLVDKAELLTESAREGFYHC